MRHRWDGGHADEGAWLWHERCSVCGERRKESLSRQSGWRPVDLALGEIIKAEFPDVQVSYTYKCGMGYQSAMAWESDSGNWVAEVRSNEGHLFRIRAEDIGPGKDATARHKRRRAAEAWQRSALATEVLEGDGWERDGMFGTWTKDPN